MQMDTVVDPVYILIYYRELQTYYLTRFLPKTIKTRKHSRRMHTDRIVIRPSSEQVAMRPIVDRQTPVKTVPSPCGR